MTREEMARLVAEGLIETGIEGGYDAVSCSTAGDYPSLGVSQWEGGRADDLLRMIPGGGKYVGREYSDIEESDELEALSELLDSPEGQEAQIQKLSEDCLDYVDELLDVAGFDDPACIVYAGMWCPTSTSVVCRFVYNRLRRGYDMNDLEVCAETFRDEYAEAAACEEYAEGYANRAERTLEYVESLGIG